MEAALQCVGAQHGEACSIVLAAAYAERSPFLVSDLVHTVNLAESTIRNALTILIDESYIKRHTQNTLLVDEIAH